jgi:hypothetical protein
VKKIYRSRCAFVIEERADELVHLRGETALVPSRIVTGDVRVGDWRDLATSDAGAEARVTVEVVDGQPRVTRLEAERVERLKLPLARIRDTVIAEAIEDPAVSAVSAVPLGVGQRPIGEVGLSSSDEIETLTVRADRRRRIRRGAQLSDEDCRLVAEIASRAERRGVTPGPLVQKELHMTKSEAYRRMKVARTRGFL